jgi:hypothetical protein
VELQSSPLPLTKPNLHPCCQFAFIKCRYAHRRIWAGYKFVANFYRLITGAVGSNPFGKLMYCWTLMTSCVGRGPCCEPVTYHRSSNKRAQDQHFPNVILKWERSEGKIHISCRITKTPFYLRRDPKSCKLPVVRVITQKEWTDLQDMIMSYDSKRQTKIKLTTNRKQTCCAVNYGDF